MHPQIYQWMEEGSSHFRLEIAWTSLLLEEKRQANSPKVRTEGKTAPPWLQQGCWPPLGARAYLSGLWRMATLSNVFCGPGRPMSAGVRAKEKCRPKNSGTGWRRRSPRRPGNWKKSWFRFPARQTAPGKSAPVPHRAAPGRTTAPGRPSPYACGGVSPTHLLNH